MHRSSLLFAVAALLGSQVALADDTTVTWTTVSSTAWYASSDDLDSLMDEIDGNYAWCSTEVSSAWNLTGHGTCGSPTTDLGFHLGVEFEICDSGDYEFRYGADYGRGGALFIDGAKVDGDTRDLWWAGNWGASSEILTGVATLGAGVHTVDAIGFEGCCDGAQAMQFRVDGGAWTTVSPSALGDGVCDGDGDGVEDSEDACPDTGAGELVDASGCSIDDLCPCDGDWSNHGAYVSCVTQAANAFKADGLISGKDKGDITAEAAGSDCGK